ENREKFLAKAEILWYYTPVCDHARPRTGGQVLLETEVGRPRMNRAEDSTIKGGIYPMAVVSMKQLLEAGVHFGHQTRRWNPKMAAYIYTERNGIYIIDLQKTVKKLEEAYSFVRDIAANGQSLLFVGTKKQAQEAI